ncbi:hypothetical protein [Halopseudomonas maritima]|uniref:hypothetical protein n=1 Tax=Halopseudomonas maritima TaxID=2918528 RepID=UPI001EEA8F88|nr:hypothetical protein [Halopseudomonas maritima]UJJ31086.1 hypothetical protein HV822_15160 [Halopseudomonas maritima]
MIKPWVRYNAIEEKRDGYYVEYNPVFTGGEFAMLTLHIYEPLENIKEIAESELEHWALRYATPIMLMIDNKTNEKWRTKDKVGHNFLLGYAKKGKIIQHWDEYPESEKPKFDLSKEKLKEIYSDLGSTTYEEVAVKQENEAKSRKILLIGMTVWICIIPVTIEIIGWSSPVFSAVVLIYSWYVAFQKGRSLWGKRKKTEKEIAEEKERLEKEHHHHHCKLNPEGFLRLKNENFEKERIAKERKKIDSMKKQKIQ